MDKKLYRPASGTEGEHFFQKFCYKCQYDKDFKNPCDIIILSMCYDLTDKEYPKEWILENNQPKCLKFKKIQKPTQGNTHG